MGEIVERKWEGETILIVASGPSLEFEDVELCRDRMRCITVNDSWKAAPWAEVLYACDYRWWKLHNGVPEFKGEKWTQDRRAKEQFPEIHKVIGENGKPGLSFDQKVIHNGKNGGYQAINLAVLFGAKRIILTGLDCQRTDGWTHWFGDHQGLHNTVDYPAFIKCFNTIPESIRDKDIAIINCTRQTALKCFPRMTIEEAIDCYGRNRDAAAGGVREVPASLPTS